MDLLKKPSHVDALINNLEWITISSVERWLVRLRTVAGDIVQTNSDTERVDFLETHRHRLWRLLAQAAAFPEAQPKAAELALMIDPAMQTRGFYAAWLPIVESIALALTDNVAVAPLIVAKLWRCAGNCYRRLGKEQRALEVFTIAEKFTVDQGEAGLDFGIELRQARGGTRALQTRFEEAEQIAFQLLEDARALGDFYTEAHGRALLAYSYLQSYRVRASFEQGQQAYLLWKHLNHETGQARALHYMGEACRLSQRPHRARFYLETTCDRLAKLKERAWQAHLEHSLGTLAIDEHRPDEAVQRISTARALFETIGDERNVLSSTHALGIALTRAGQYPEAEKALLKALEGWDRLKSRIEIANVRYALADLLRRNGRLAEARQAFEETLQIAQDLPPGEHRDHLIKELEEKLSELQD